MRGKVSYRHPQPSQHFIVDVAPLSPATLDALRDALGRSLTPAEQNSTARIVDSARFWRERARVRTSAESRKATLAALANESDDCDVIHALDACDPTTRAHVWDGVLVHLGMSAADLAKPSNVKAAAQAALEHFHDERGPRNTHLPMLAAGAVTLWRALGGKDCVAATWQDRTGRDKRRATPIVHFAAALFAASGNPRSLSAIAKLMNEAPGANIG